MIAGVDFSTRAVDVVLLDEDSDAATWHRFELVGSDAFDRSRYVTTAMPFRTGAFWDDILAVGIEDPRGYGAGSLYRVQGAILACIPHGTLVHPLIPSQWRKTVGLSGRASKGEIAEWVFDRLETKIARSRFFGDDFPAYDRCDAYCIALATRSLLQHGEKAA